MRDSHSSPRPSSLFWLLGLVAIVLVMPAAVGGVGEVRFAAMERWAADQTREWQQHDFRRPALWGATMPGSAFARYDQATRWPHDLRSNDDNRTLAALRLHPERVAPEAAAALWQRFGPAIAALREGAHCEDARSLADPAAGPKAVRLINFVASYHLANMMVVEAHDLLRAGRGEESVELLLDAATVGADLVGSPATIEQSTGMGILGIATSGALDDHHLRDLEPAALEALASGLRRLDDLLPAAPRLEGDILRLARASLVADPTAQLYPDDWGLDSYRHTWRHGFSVHWARAHAVMTQVWITGDLRNHEHLPWTARDEIIRRHREQLARSSDPWLRSWPGLHVERNLRHALTGIRLLRLAVDAHLRRPLAPLADPLGDGELRVVEHGDEVRITSAGQAQGHPIERLAVRR